MSKVLPALNRFCEGSGAEGLCPTFAFELVAPLFHVFCAPVILTGKSGGFCLAP